MIVQLYRQSTVQYELRASQPARARARALPAATSSPVVSALRASVGTVVAMPFSTVINAAGWPISRDSSLFKDDFDKFIVEPWEYSFERRVGEDLAGF